MPMFSDNYSRKSAQYNSVIILWEENHVKQLGTQSFVQGSISQFFKINQFKESLFPVIRLILCELLTNQFGETVISYAWLPNRLTSSGKHRFLKSG